MQPSHAPTKVVAEVSASRAICVGTHGYTNEAVALSPRQMTTAPRRATNSPPPTPTKPRAMPINLDKFIVIFHGPERNMTTNIKCTLASPLVHYYITIYVSSLQHYTASPYLLHGLYTRIVYLLEVSIEMLYKHALIAAVSYMILTLVPVPIDEDILAD